MCRAFVRSSDATAARTVNALGRELVQRLMQGSYRASKAAEWSLTRRCGSSFARRERWWLPSCRLHRHRYDQRVDASEDEPDVIAARVLAGIESGSEEILAEIAPQASIAELFKDGEAFEANMQKT
jgi:hypothetical protein